MESEHKNQRELTAEEKFRKEKHNVILTEDDINNKYTFIKNNLIHKGEFTGFNNNDMNFAKVIVNDEPMIINITPNALRVNAKHLQEKHLEAKQLLANAYSEGEKGFRVFSDDPPPPPYTIDEKNSNGGNSKKSKSKKNKKSKKSKSIKRKRY
jgi:hypothetical protein